MSDKSNKGEEHLRNKLAHGESKSMWVNETSLEYRRLLHLRELGHNVHPARDSLLDEFVKGAEETLFNGVNDPSEIYEETFGHRLPYCWTTPVSNLSEASAPNSPMPGTAWIPDSTD